MKYLVSTVVLFLICAANCCPAANLRGADQNTPSKAQYFSWINNDWVGSTERNTLANLAFFKWLHDEYGMQLDIYALDAGNLDRSKRKYGTLESEHFKEKFPRGFKPLADAAAQMNTRLGLWGGPDGFGDTLQSEQKRIDLISGLCRDYNLGLLKFDAACGKLRPEKSEAFIRMMQQCRKYSPDLIALNHRIPMEPNAEAYMTTFLMGGQETYIDVHLCNRVTAPHNRAEALARETPADLNRLTEDHGVCISSCLDYWDDDLVLQAFNRCMILAPEIYGNPWLLADSEFAKLARIYNLHNKYGAILVKGKFLPEEKYGKNAVSRGDAKTRFITLRNLSWNPVTYNIKLDGEIGIESDGMVEVRQLHPVERIVGSFKAGTAVPVETGAFRSSLIYVTAVPEINKEIGIAGCDYEVIRDMPGRPVVISLKSKPGMQKKITLVSNDRKFSKASIDQQDAGKLLKGKSIKVSFSGKKLSKPFHRKLGTLERADLPADWQAGYEATCFAADNDALEVRSLRRSGQTAVKQVQTARDEFFNQPSFVSRGVWDKFAFDGDANTYFSYIDPYKMIRKRIKGSMTRIDFGKDIKIAKLVFTAQLAEPNLQPAPTQAAFSRDFASWQKADYKVSGDTITVSFPENSSARYVRVPVSLAKTFEVEGYGPDGNRLDRQGWKQTIFFKSFDPASAWTGKVTIDEAGKGSYLAVAVPGRYNFDGAWVSAKCRTKYIGAPLRAISFESSVYEAPVAFILENSKDKQKANYGNLTYYIPVTSEMIGQDITVNVLGDKSVAPATVPQVWITAYPEPYETKTLVLE